MAKAIYTNIKELMTLSGALAKNAKGAMSSEDLGLQKNQAIVVDGARIAWVGPQKKIPREYLKIKKNIQVNGNMYPGFIDCHTHSVFAGDRVNEFEMRINGKSYQEIASQGGGILSTVRATRNAKLSTLIKSLDQRLHNFLRQGVTTVEVKTGYGLTAESELKLLKAIKNKNSSVKTVATFLGAHSLPQEIPQPAKYLEYLKALLPKIQRQKLAQRVDIFIEKNYFSVAEARDYLSFAKQLGFEIAIHADQLSRTGAALLATELSTRSADHVICVNNDDIKELAFSDVTSVLLPTADFYLRCPYPPARQLLDQGARVALATDYNPGTSPTQNIQWVGLLARQEMKMTLPEVFVALTLGGSHALGLQTKQGVLMSGFCADFFTSDVPWNEFFYSLDSITMKHVCIDGLLQKI